MVIYFGPISNNHEDVGSINLTCDGWPEKKRLFVCMKPVLEAIRSLWSLHVGCGECRRQCGLLTSCRNQHRTIPTLSCWGTVKCSFYTWDTDEQPNHVKSCHNSANDGRPIRCNALHLFFERVNLYSLKKSKLLLKLHSSSGNCSGRGEPRHKLALVSTWSAHELLPSSVLSFFSMIWSFRCNITVIVTWRHAHRQRIHCYR